MRKRLQTVIKEVRELAFRQMQFEKLPEEEQQKQINNFGLFPDWNQEYMAEYAKPRTITFWLDNESNDLTAIQKDALASCARCENFDGWVIDDCKIEVGFINGTATLDMIVTIKNDQ